MVDGAATGSVDAGKPEDLDPACSRVRRGRARPSPPRRARGCAARPASRPWFRRPRRPGGRRRRRRSTGSRSRQDPWQRRYRRHDGAAADRRRAPGGAETRRWRRPRDRLGQSRGRRHAVEHHRVPALRRDALAARRAGGGAGDAPALRREQAGERCVPSSPGRRRAADDHSCRVLQPFARARRCRFRAPDAAMRSASRRAGIGEPEQCPHRHRPHQRRGIAEQRSTCGSRDPSPELPAAISTLRTKRSRPVRLIGVPAKRAPERGVVESEQGRRAAGCRSPARAAKPRLAGRCRELVPRADGEAVVAAEHAIADRPRGTRAAMWPLCSIVR